jgi:hypothetical protein
VVSQSYCNKSTQLCAFGDDIHHHLQAPSLLLGSLLDSQGCTTFSRTRFSKVKLMLFSHMAKLKKDKYRT